MLKLCLIAIVCCLVGVAQAQMIKQCQCSQITPCKETYLNSIVPCMDSCQQHATSLGANYGQLKQCVMALEPKLKQAISCVEGAHGEACTNGAGGMVPKRYPETLKIAALSEINRMLGQMGIADEARQLMSQGKKIYGCVSTCMTKKSGNCEKKLGCGLKLPADSVLVQNGKQCAMQSGINTASLQQLCNCMSAAGVKSLAPLCKRIIIS